MVEDEVRAAAGLMPHIQGGFSLHQAEARSGLVPVLCTHVTPVAAVPRGEVVQADHQLCQLQQLFC